MRWTIYQRLAMTFLVSGFVLATGGPGTADDQPGNKPATVGDAERAAELAELRWLQFQRIEYPRAMRRLESEIKLTEAQIASLRRQEREYAQFEKNLYSAPLFYTLEKTRLALTAATLKLSDLREERLRMQQFRGQQARLYELEAAEAARWARQLQAP